MRASQIYRTKSKEPNPSIKKLNYQIKSSKEILPKKFYKILNEIYQTEFSKPNLVNLFYQTKSTKQGQSPQNCTTSKKGDFFKFCFYSTNTNGLRSKGVLGSKNLFSES